jgi:hypothetical protein
MLSQDMVYLRRSIQARLGASLSAAPGLTYRSLSARLAKRGLVFPMRDIECDNYAVADYNMIFDTELTIPFIHTDPVSHE